MALDISLLAKKLQAYRQQFQLEIPEIAVATGIDVASLTAYESAQRIPSGDEILILADFYKCDYKFFISNEKLAAFEQTEILFRRYGDAFSKNDRWSVQEFLFLADNEEFLIQSLGNIQRKAFYFTKSGRYFKGHGIDAARGLRVHLNYKENEVPQDIYRDFRTIGIHVFRRKLENSNISGLYIKHPTAGKCVLVNYSEDVYRQRFTAAHEIAHTILDEGEDVIVSFTKWEQNNLVEIRANTFASNFLMPPDFIKAIPEANIWSESKARSWASRLMVSTEALAYSLKQNDLIDNATEEMIKQTRVPKEQKTDPELPVNLSEKGRERKAMLLQSGLSDYYVKLCFSAYRNNIISLARLAEMLLIDERILPDMAALYGERLQYAS